MKILFPLLLVPVLAFGQAFTFQDIPFLSQGATDWANRVVANGGAMPSPNTVRCMETLRQTLISQGITNKIHSMCVFVPDSVIAATTPLFKHKGIDPWGNSNFVSGDLNIQGLKGDGSTKSLNTGVTSQQAATNGASIERGFTVVVSESATNQTSVTMGWQEPDASPYQLIQISSAGVSSWLHSDNTGVQEMFTNDFARVGYYSGNVFTNGSGTNLTIYVASPLETHKTLSSLIKTHPFSVPPAAVDVSCFAVNNGTNSNWSAQRLSVAIVTAGFSPTESSNLWNALRTCRECLGGGTGDPVYDWNKRMVANGGSDVSTTTSNALRTFYTGLDTDDLLYRVVLANAFVPDNLFAARSPIIWQGGGPIWTNFNFGTTNLTVNGLQGNGTDKYLATGYSNSPNRLLTTTSGGISLLMHANPDTAGNGLLGMQGAGNAHFGIFSFAGTGLFRCWAVNLVNQNFVTASVSPQTNGWISGNRTAANAIALYKARGDQVHTLVTNATGVQNGTAFTTFAPYVFALNNAGPASAFSAPTISFASIHSGMTQTQNSNYYVRVSTLRTAVGGGNP